MNNREAAYKHFMQHEIRIGSAYSDVFYAGFDAALASQAQQPAGWQRRLKFATNGQVHQWELCKTSEATDNFERSPHHEYRQIFTMQSQAQQEPVKAIPIGFDYLDNGQLVATYAVPVRDKGHPKLYTASQAQQKCSCVRATSRNTPAVKAGYEMGGYVKNVCTYCQSQAQQTENHKAKIKAWCNTLEKAADNFERHGYSGESADLLDIKAYIQPLPPAPEGDKP